MELSATPQDARVRRSPPGFGDGPNDAEFDDSGESAGTAWILLGILNHGRSGECLGREDGQWIATSCSDYNEGLLDYTSAFRE